MSPHEAAHELREELAACRKLNAELLSKVKLLFSYVYLTEADEDEIRELIAKAEKLK